MTFELAGIPSVSVITEPFAFKARAEVKALGVPMLPIQILPHPIGQISDAEMRALTDEAYEEIVFGLTASTDEVAAAYDGAVAARTSYSQ